jgi:hypothetical protein
MIMIRASRIVFRRKPGSSRVIRGLSLVNLQASRTKRLLVTSIVAKKPR